MRKRLHHRKPRFLRAAAIVAWALQGLFAPWGSTPVYAANPDTAVLSVRAGSNAPPDPVADLLASPNPSVAGRISLTWSAPQAYAGGIVPNVAVSSYTVHLATFSVDSMGGNTSAWWTATSAGSVTLQPPTHVPQSPGSLEAHTFDGLISGTRYYFAIRSVNPVGIQSPIDTLAATPSLQASAIPAYSTAFAPPQAPNGLLSTSLSNGTQVELRWTPVTEDISHNPVTIDHYLIHRYTAIGSTATNTVIVPAAQSTYTESTAGGLWFYRIQAVSNVSAISSYSDYLDSNENRYAIASDDLMTRVVMPRDAALNLLAANNTYNRDLQILVTRQAADEVNVTLRSYRVSAWIPSTGEHLSQYTFPQNNISVQLGYGAVVGGSLGQPVSINPQAPFSADALAQILSVYWFNGSSYIRVGDPQLVPANQSIAVTVRNLGVYQIRAIVLASKFKLTQGSPYPRVITPHGAENRRVFWFFDNPTGDTVSGEIYDIRGAKVRALNVNSMSPTPNSLVWDGRDSHGAVVPSGVYLYKISTPEETVTGTVVVAR